MFKFFSINMLMYHGYSIIIYIYSIIIIFFKKLFFFVNIESIDNGKHVKWNPNLYTTDYTYSKEEYDRKYTGKQEYSFFSFH